MHARRNSTRRPAVLGAILVATTGALSACEAPPTGLAPDRDFLHSISPRRQTQTAQPLARTQPAVAPAPRVPGDPGPSPTLGAPPPATLDTVVLFDGGSFDRWRQRDGTASQWEPLSDGSVLVRGGDAVTRDAFGSFQLHLEFYCPEMPEKAGQARANSGVYVHGRYEVQVLDTFGQDPFPGGCGGIYSIAPPIVNASRPAGLFQTYDIFFRAPVFDGDRLATPPSVTVVHNGIVVHNNLVLPHTTPGGLDETMQATGPILLQDHGDPIRYRNIWIRRLP